MTLQEKVCTEMTFILEQVPSSYIRKIPKEIIEKIKINISPTRYRQLDKSKTFYNQDISDETLELLEWMSKAYWM